MNFLRKMIVTGFGTGYLPVSGTWGSLVTVVIFLAVAFVCTSVAYCACGQHRGTYGYEYVLAAMFVTAMLASIACVQLGDFTEQTWKKKDPKQCTIDEVAGQAVALLAVPVPFFHPSSRGPWIGWLITAGVCFVLFRIMDILKPFPARRFEKLPKGWGVLLDDLMAGVYANIAAQVLLRGYYGWMAPQNFHGWW